MDTERLGFELAEAIIEMTHESLDDIRSALRKPSQNVLLEYITLLLWIVAKQASSVLPKESIQSTIDHAHSVTFFFLADAGFRKIRMLGGYFNEKTFEDYICARFKLYYGAWKAFPKPDDFSRAEKAQASEILVAHYFAVCCFGGETELREVFPTAEADLALVEQILYPLHRFSERIKSILSRFDSNQEQTSNNVLGELGTNPVESMVQYPIFLQDTDEYMYKVCKEDELQSKLEINDILDNEYVCWDSIGRRLDIYQEGGVIKVKFADTQINFDELKQAISNYARIFKGAIVNPNDFSNAKTMFDVI